MSEQELSPKSKRALELIAQIEDAEKAGDEDLRKSLIKQLQALNSQKDENGNVLADDLPNTDLGNAKRLLKYADGRLKYVSEWKSWVVYKDGRWIRDSEDVAVIGFAGTVSAMIFKEFAELQGDEREAMFKVARMFEWTKTVRSMLTPAKSLEGIAASPDDFDTKPYLFNVLNGTVDIRTGELRQHNPEDMQTKQSMVWYDPDAECPLWEKSISEWMEDPEDQRFLQQVLGTAISGYPETLILVNVGGGANGKSVCFNTIEHVLGTEDLGYAAVADNSLFVKTRNGNFQAAVSKLYRARLAIGSETESGDKLEEAQMKTITGGDRIICRPLYQNPWSFNPTHTMVLHTNYLPNVRNQDAGMWRRLMVLKWRKTFQASAGTSVNANLADQLRQQAPGILNWLIRGYQMHVKLDSKIKMSPNVIKDSQEYREEEDHVGQFLKDNCVVTMDEKDKVVTSEFRAAYVAWCSLNGLQAWSDKAIGMQLRQKNFEPFRTNKARGYSGFKIKDISQRDLPVGYVVLDGMQD